MSLFKLNKWMGSSSGNSHDKSASTQTAKQNVTPQVSGIAQLITEGPPRADGSDKFFGMENVVNGEKFGNTCYCNSILQCLYFSKPFRESVINFPNRGLPRSENIDSMDGSALPSNGNPRANLARINTEPTVPTTTTPNSTMRGKSPLSPTKEDSKRKSIPMVAAIQTIPGAPGRLEDPNAPEAKKKAALLAGPVLRIDNGYSSSYGMQESLFSSLKDIFESILSHNSRTGVVSPTKFVEILKRDNEMFRSSLHQDAHEFLNYVLNQVIENVDEYQKRIASEARMNGSAGSNKQVSTTNKNGSLTPIPDSSAASTSSVEVVSHHQAQPAVPSTGWIHDLFEGLLTSETKCLTCENISRRDEVFLDLSIDLERHTSVTSCLKNFSASEMLCERNKFHCDGCGGLQEAEKRMKIKRLPRILALHLKRFKYSEDIGRHQKLFHRVMYPYYLRLFNTTDDAEDPDRLYELYAVVVHIGGGPYHGHYVAIVKTEDKGWLLFDDELVEPVNKEFVRNFFGGDERKLACAYVLFYQETTFEKMNKEMNEEEEEAAAAEAMEKAKASMSTADAGEKAAINGHHNDSEEGVPLGVSKTSPFPFSSSEGKGLSSATQDVLVHDPRTPAAVAAEHPLPPKSKKEREKEKKDDKKATAAMLKAAAAKFMETEEHHHKEKEKGNGLSRFSKGSLRGANNWFSGKGGKEKSRKVSVVENGSALAPEQHHNHQDLHHFERLHTPTENGNIGISKAPDSQSHIESENNHRNHLPHHLTDPQSQTQAQEKELPVTPTPKSEALYTHTHTHTPIPQSQPQATTTPTVTPTKEPKEKKKGFLSGLKRKTSTML